MADYDDIAAPLLDAEVHELLEETSLEELERVRDRYFGGRDSHGPISRAIKLICVVSTALWTRPCLTENLEKAPQLWNMYGPPPVIELGRGLEL